MYLFSKVQFKLGLLAVAFILWVFLSDLILATPLPYSEYRNLNDNQIPAGWTYFYGHGTAGIQNGRLEAGPGDAYCTLDRPGTLPFGAAGIKIEYDGNIETNRYMSHGANVDVGVVEDFIYWWEGTDIWTPPGNCHFRLQLAGGIILIDDFRPIVNGTNHYIISIWPGKIRYQAIGSIPYDRTVYDSRIDIYNLQQIGYRVYTAGSSCVGWLDNLSYTALFDGGGGEEPNLSIAKIEVNQGIQTEGNFLPLIAFKPTVVRVYLSPSSEMTNIDVELYMDGEDVYHKVGEERNKTIYPSICYLAEHVALGINSINFYTNSITTGNHSFLVIVKQSGVEICRNSYDFVFNRTYDMRLISRRLNINGVNTTIDDQLIDAWIIPFLKKVLPVANIKREKVNDLTIPFSTSAPHLFGNIYSDIFGELATYYKLSGLIRGLYEIDYTIGFINQDLYPDPLEDIGRADLPHTLFYQAYPPDYIPLITSIHFRRDGLENGVTIAHEIGHHCGAYRNTEQYIEENGQITYWGITLSQHDHGFDVMQKLPINTTTNTVYDIMASSFSSTKRWIWAGTYNTIYNNWPKVETKKKTLDATQATGMAALVSGAVSENDSVIFGEIYKLAVDSTASYSLSESTHYRINFINALNDSLMARYYLSAEHQFGGNDSSFIGYFNGLFPCPESPFKIKIYKDTVFIGQRIPSAHPPSVSIAYPSSGDIISGNCQIQWHASDLDSDSLRTAVLYSYDGGNWSCLANNVRDSVFTWNSDDFPGGNSCHIRIIVSDGLNSTEDTSGIFSVAQKQPSCWISDPRDSLTQVHGWPVIFNGGGIDPEDGELPDSLLTWTSNLDGIIGHGSNMATTQLSVGIHQIVLSCHDSDNNFSYDTSYVTILQDIDNDGMPDVWETANGTNPIVNDAELDPDNDELDNLSEYYFKCNPQIRDTDGDSYSDGEEVTRESDPTNASSIPTQVFLSSFSLWYPVYDMTINDSTPTFRWSVSTPIDAALHRGYIFYFDTDSSFSNPFTAICTTETFVFPANLSDSMHYYWKVKAADEYGHYVWCNNPASFWINYAAPSCDYMIGDINSDGNRIGGDVTYGVRYFKGIGPNPPDSCFMDSTGTYLFVAGDVNGNCEFRGSDITRLVSYFKGTAALANCHFFPPPPLRENINILLQNDR